MGVPPQHQIFVQQSRKFNRHRAGICVRRSGTAGADRAAGRHASSEIAQKAGSTDVPVSAWRSATTRQASRGWPTTACRRGRADRPPNYCDGHAETIAEKAGGHVQVLRQLATRLLIEQRTAAKAWREYQVVPWREGAFMFPADPELVAKDVDIVGLCLTRPENAVVLFVNGKSQIHALKHASPRLAIQPGKPAAQTHDYVRHETSTLFAALEVATGSFTAVCEPRHRHQKFLTFLNEVDRAQSNQGLHLVMDNCVVHKTPEVKAQLAENRPFQVHFTPTWASRMNLVEGWFWIIERQAMHRADVASVPELNKRIRVSTSAEF